MTRNLAEVEPLLDNEPLANSYYQIIVYATGVHFLNFENYKTRIFVVLNYFGHNVYPEPTVYTGPVTNAGTTSDVGLRLVGTLGFSN